MALLFSLKVLLEVLTLFLPVGYNVGMKKQQEEMTIEFMDELDLSRGRKTESTLFLMLWKRRLAEYRTIIENS